MIIVDMGSGETCRNDTVIVKQMIDALASVSSHKQQIVIKWQLFEKVGDLLPLKHSVFEYAWQYAEMYDFQTTASIFDDASLAYLLKFNPPFVKIACREYLYKYINKINRWDIRAIVSINHPKQKAIIGKANYLCCVPEYPANRTVYESMFGGNLSVGISDHTPDFRLYKQYQPYIFESHFKLQDSIGADNGAWAKTPQQWAEIL